MIEKHKFNLLEIQECLDTYCLRKDQAEQVSFVTCTDLEKYNATNIKPLWL